MPTLNTIIVDDEEFARSSLYFLLQQNCPQISICGIAKSVNEARVLLQSHPIDLVFLDIAMPGENGFSLISDIQKTNASVIFTTAYDHYAIKAIKANALDYLLKPIDIEELVVAVAKANEMRLRNEGQNNPALGSLESVIKEQKTISKITLPSGQGYKLISVDEIVHIEADSNYSIFHLKNGENLTVSKVLKDYEEVLPEEKFMRIHKSSIVNLKYVKEYNTKNGLQITLTNTDQLVVSRRRASDFFEKIKNYAQTQIEN